MQEYILLENTADRKNFIKSVNAYLEAGWQLHGPTTVLAAEDLAACKYIQAFVKSKGGDVRIFDDQDEISKAFDNDEI